jgi:DNA-binding NarL/FixJ family response regulator
MDQKLVQSDACLYSNTPIIKASLSRPSRALRDLSERGKLSGTRKDNALSSWQSGETEEKMAIRILLVDDHPAMRAGIQGALEKATDIEVVGEASDGESAWRLIETLSPDLILLDCRLGEVDGVEVAKRIQADGRDTRVLAMSAHDDDHYVYGMLQAGAAGYILKHEALKTVVEAVRTVAAGEAWYSQKVMSRMAAWARGRQPTLAGLTERELEVLRLMAKGWDNQRIAEELSISEGTVKNHVTNLYDKLEVHSRAEAVAWTWQQGLMDK